MFESFFANRKINNKFCQVNHERERERDVAFPHFELKGLGLRSNMIHSLRNFRVCLHDIANSDRNRSQPNRRIDKLAIPSVSLSLSFTERDDI